MGLVTLLCCVVFMGEPELGPRTDNAAIDYLRAGATLDRERVGELYDTWKKADCSSVALTGGIDDDGRWFLLGTLAQLERGSRKTECDFDPPYELGDWASFDIEFNHGVSQAITLSIAWFRSPVAHSNPRPRDAERAVRLIEVGVRWASCWARNAVLVDALGAAGALRTIGEEWEALLALESDRSDFSGLLAELGRDPRLPVSATELIARDREWFRSSLRNWSEAWPDTARPEREQKISDLLFFVGDRTDDIRRKLLADIDEVPARISTWFEEFDAITAIPEDAARARSLAEALPSLEQVDRRGEALLADFEAGRSDNFFVDSSVMDPTLTSVFHRVAQTEAYFRLLLIATAAYEARRAGKSYATLSDLDGYFPNGVPRDPLSGGAFDYRVVDGSPIVSVSFHGFEETIDLRPIRVAGSGFVGYRLPPEEATAFGIETTHAHFALRSEIEALEAALSEHPPTVEFPLEAYSRQYVGYTKDGRRFLFANFAEREALSEIADDVEEFERRAFVVDDGGSAFFQVVFDVAEGKIVEVRINGEA
ncbi:MAG: hypothetical protein KDC38_15170 [Planctomycetes bacterium]|nr:hypothetical protein [Planctomycetota bacterium]